jgi:far upstream element-binding protein
MCIGRQGCVIRELQQRTKTRIQIPPSVPGQEFRIITITGPPEGCQKIQEIISRIIMEQSSQFVMTGECFQAVYPYGQQAAYGQYYQQAYASTGAVAQADYSAQWAAYYASLNQSGGATAGLAQTSTAATTSSSAAAASMSTATGDSQQQLAPDAYYDAFFQYAYHYGEEKARQYYGAWSPPPGTPNPYGSNPALAQESGPSSG